MLMGGTLAADVARGSHDLQSLSGLFCSIIRILQIHSSHRQDRALAPFHRFMIHRPRQGHSRKCVLSGILPRPHWAAEIQRPGGSQQWGSILQIMNRSRRPRRPDLMELLIWPFCYKVSEVLLELFKKPNFAAPGQGLGKTHVAA